MLNFVTEWIKAALFEVQQYVLLCGAALRGSVTRPFYRHDVVEQFHPTSGRVTGWLTVVLASVLVVAGLAYLDEGFPPWVVAAGLLAGILAWAAMLRPALWATHEHLVMRNLAETVHIRLAAVEEMAVRQV